MTKKQNTIVFMLVATVVSLIMTIAILVVFLLVASLLLKENAATAFPFLMLLAFVSEFAIYNKLTMFVIKKFKLEDKLDGNLFKRKKNN